MQRSYLTKGPAMKLKSLAMVGLGIIWLLVVGPFWAIGTALVAVADWSYERIARAMERLEE